MSNETIETLARSTERRRFLRRAGAASLALVAGTFARVETASAVTTRGCDLCDSPTSCAGKACYWCWWGRCYGGKNYQCCEGYNSVGSCTGGCNSGQACSRIGGTRNCP